MKPIENNLNAEKKIHHSCVLDEGGEKSAERIFCAGKKQAKAESNKFSMCKSDAVLRDRFGKFSRSRLLEKSWGS